MTSGPVNNSGESGEPRRPRRRPRYAGTHPRRFDQRYKELDPAKYPAVQEHVRGQGRTPAGTHVPVLVAEVLEVLQPGPGDIVADCTVGYGGHARELLRRIAPGGRLIGLDVDAVELERTRQRLTVGLAEPAAAATVSLHRSHFAGLAKVLAAEGLDGCDVILADLGVSSMQLDDPERGFSFKHDGPLDMRMDQRLPRSAADLLLSMSEDEMAAALRDVADEPNHRRIARSIVAARASRPIATTGQLVELVFEAQGSSRRAWLQSRRGDRDLHPAARTFQALRILVNDELSGLEQFLRVAPFCLRPGGRLGVISFHSGEDQRVERALAGGLAAGWYAAVAEQAIRPGSAEIAANPRSSSARLRWARRAAAPE